MFLTCEIQKKKKKYDRRIYRGCSKLVLNSTNSTLPKNGVMYVLSLRIIRLTY